MNLDYKRIDENTFVVITDTGEEITYTNNDNVENWEITGFVFLQNELDWKIEKLGKLTYDKKTMKLNLLKMRKYLRDKKRINYYINNTIKDVDDIKKNLERTKEDNNILETNRKRRILKKW